MGGPETFSSTYSIKNGSSGNQVLNSTQSLIKGKWEWYWNKAKAQDRLVNLHHEARENPMLPRNSVPEHLTFTNEPGGIFEGMPLSAWGSEVSNAHKDTTKGFDQEFPKLVGYAAVIAFIFLCIWHVRSTGGLSLQ